ncbi:SAM-dependent methyltransferase [Bailinhaonella thermotolerans]|uniref:SAM-dependent methyltransferase n=1 Tax=Bailinhaonella thermotolerans TaxID=1070861 RepID=A0A3A4B0H4_9ACTN|nr:SAM-dependent methyltransferase [Bailinhaonella thermotolerans]
MGFDVTRPNAARIYDYLLGGKDNFAADRQAAERMMAFMPEARRIARANRAFLGRAVRFCASRGIRQFLDLGSGLPTQDNVHQVAAAVDPACRVVYVDFDPVVVQHAHALLEDADVGVVAADARDPEAVLASAPVRRLLDLSRPVAVLAVALLHFVPDEEDPAALVARFAEAMAPGSALVMTHACPDLMDPEAFAEALAVYNRGATPIHPRGRERIAALFSGFELVDPGLVEVSQWRPDRPEDSEPADAQIIGGVGLKR